MNSLTISDPEIKIPSIHQHVINILFAVLAFAHPFNTPTTFIVPFISPKKISMCWLYLIYHFSSLICGFHFVIEFKTNLFRRAGHQIEIHNQTSKICFFHMNHWLKSSTHLQTYLRLRSVVSALELSKSTNLIETSITA